MEDKRYLTQFHDMAVELERNVVEFNQRASGLTDRQKLMELHAERCEILAEIVKRHKRALDFMAGKPVEPEQHFGEAVLLPVFGGIT
jgi:hypothetical protein